ncbi:MAG: hypothetical protein KAX49_15965 [Halanaerobiales bacterium]|nr:hypothetical protein [Halanaerobiales bacterium]
MNTKDKKIDNQNVQNIFSLTPMQEGMLFHYLKNSEDNYYFEQLCLKISGKINLEVMKKAWNYVIEANEMLRTVFRWEKLRKPLQIVLKKYRVPIRIHDLSDLDDLEKEEKVYEIKEKDQIEKIDISMEPFRVTLIKLNDNESVLIISNHHILYDGWSNGIILKEFFKAYNLLYDGNIPEKVKKNSFKEFLKWHQHQNQEEQKIYWTKYLEGFDSKTMLHISSGSPTNQVATERYVFSLDKELTNCINHFVKENRITLAAFFYSVWGILLQRYNNTDDIVFGTTVSGRNAEIKGIEEIVGLFKILFLLEFERLRSQNKLY